MFVNRKQWVIINYKYKQIKLFKKIKLMTELSLVLII